jgi:hypothetical protein
MLVKIDYYEYRERGGVNVRLDLEVSSPQEVTKLLENLRGPIKQKPEHIVETTPS